MMDLKKLFETQAKLDADILKNHPIQEGEDRLSKKILALQVEMGECANEWRGFKFWSNKQKPRKRSVKPCLFCEGIGEKQKIDIDNRVSYEFCDECEGTGDGLVYDPLLEEYVDCLHFILSIGLDLDMKIESWKDEFFIIPDSTDENITNKFLYVIGLVNKIYNELRNNEGKHAKTYWLHLFENFFGLGEILGYSRKEVEQAYYEKNKINLQRQENGY